MSKFKSPTNTPVRIANTGGHVVLVGPGGRVIPDFMDKEALANGCLPVGKTTAGNVVGGDSGSGSMGGGEETPLSPKHRADAIAGNILKLLDGNNEEDFTSAGTPNLNILSKMCDFQVKKDEMLPIWEKIKEEEGIGSDEE